MDEKKIKKNLHRIKSFITFVKNYVFITKYLCRAMTKVNNISIIINSASISSAICGNRTFRVGFGMGLF